MKNWNDIKCRDKSPEKIEELNKEIEKTLKVMDFKVGDFVCWNGGGIYTHSHILEVNEELKICKIFDKFEFWVDIEKLEHVKLEEQTHKYFDKFKDRSYLSL